MTLPRVLAILVAIPYMTGCAGGYRARNSLLRSTPTRRNAEQWKHDAAVEPPDAKLFGMVENEQEAILHQDDDCCVRQ